MDTKNSLLQMLELNKGKYISGHIIGEKLGISRTAVWKAAASLKEDGFLIESAPRTGYRLSHKCDKLSAPGIKKHLENKVFDITVFSHTTSTNDECKMMAEKGEKEFCVAVSEHQTKGRGRMGRSFYSPEGTGIYFSVLLRPMLPLNQALFITSAAAVAAAEGIEKVTARETGIKWVNDVFCGGLKVCGILTEASIDLENGMFTHVIVGTGINVASPSNGFPDELNNIAVSLFKPGEYTPGLRSRLLAAVLDSFYRYYTALPRKEFLEPYRSKSILTGQTVTVLRGDSSFTARVLGIDENCRLVAETEDGTVLLDSGEVRVKMKL